MILVLAALVACPSAGCSLGGAGVRPESPAVAGEPPPTTATDLGTGPVPPADGAPEAYAFTFEETLTADGDTWQLTATGRAVHGDLICRVRVEGPGTPLDRDLIVADGRLWARHHEAGDYLPVGGGNPADRALLAYCPAWPPGPAAAGLSGLMVGEPARYTLAGGEALGFQAGAAGLEAAIGTGLGSALVEAFHFWVAADTGWVVEVAFTVSGAGGDLLPLLGPLPAPNGPLRLVARHRLGATAADEPISPPT